MRTVRIFPSSPGDVGPERQAFGRVIARLQTIYSEHITFEVEDWQSQIYAAGTDFQSQIAAMASFDLVIGILWMRIGSELAKELHQRPGGGAWQSGTAYEIETALAASIAQRQARRLCLLQRPTACPSRQPCCHAKAHRRQSSGAGGLAQQGFQQCDRPGAARVEPGGLGCRVRDAGRGPACRLADQEGFHPGRTGLGCRAEGLALSRPAPLRPLTGVPYSSAGNLRSSRAWSASCGPCSGQTASRSCS